MNGDESVIVFSSELGWMALRASRSGVRQLTFGHASAKAAAKAVGDGLPKCENLSSWQRDAVDFLQRYAEGIAVDFSDLPVELDVASEFRADVLNACRQIPYGQTVSYGLLAARVGVPGAARAVGTCMARNPLPLIIPCHRVTRAGGEIGPYSAAKGTTTKRRLLEMEAAGAAAPVAVHLETCC